MKVAIYPNEETISICSSKLPQCALIQMVHTNDKINYVIFMGGQF